MIDRIYAQPGGVDVSEFNFEFQLNLITVLYLRARETVFL